jgi:hypothetical protein
MVAWKKQKLVLDGGVGLVSSGKDCWRVSTKVNLLNPNLGSDAV